MLCQRGTAFLMLLSLLVLTTSRAAQAEDAFSLNAEEFEKKTWSNGGFAEIKWEHMDVRQGSALSLLNMYDDPQTDLDQLSGSLQLNGAYSKGIAQLHWLLNATGQENNFGWYDTADIYESYLNITPSSGITASVGKKSYKWGKGYAWNPVGYINRTKDPNNPEEALEGFNTSDFEMIRSFSGDLQNIALTTALLPVWQGVNEDFGAEDNLNLAAKLYLLYLNTDIDFIVYSGNSRTTRFGGDFSRNLTTNFEIHGEAAYIPEVERVTLNEGGQRVHQSGSATSYLAGIRYLTKYDLTSIIEYYHNGLGYTEDEMSQFYQRVATGGTQWALTGNDTLLQQMLQLSAQGYSRPNPGRDYLYARFSLKEPFDILYFTPAVTTILNLDDQSFSVTPELTYTGITNWELQLRFSLLNGDQSTEFGEKQNSNKLELRIRYFL
jgi:hypothetical protein